MPDSLDTIKASVRENSRAKKMPSKSPAQARMMAAAAHDPKFAKKVGVPQNVASEFNQADKGSDMMHQAMMKHKMMKRMEKRHA